MQNFLLGAANTEPQALRRLHLACRRKTCGVRIGRILLAAIGAGGGQCAPTPMRVHANTRPRNCAPLQLLAATRPYPGIKFRVERDMKRYLGTSHGPYGI